MTAELNFLESKYIKPVKEAGGVRFHLKRAIPREDVPDYSYSGPFAVKDTSDGETKQVTVSAGKIIAGINQAGVAQKDIGISDDTFIYLELSYVDSAYSAEIKTSASTPSLSYTKYIVVLAEVTFEDSKIKKINQKWQYGDIYVAGRFV